MWELIRGDIQQEPSKNVYCGGLKPLLYLWTEILGLISSVVYIGTDFIARMSF